MSTQLASIHVFVATVITFSWLCCLSFGVPSKRLSGLFVKRFPSQALRVSDDDTNGVIPYHYMKHDLNVMECVFKKFPNGTEQNIGNVFMHFPSQTTENNQYWRFVPIFEGPISEDLEDRVFTGYFALQLLGYDKTKHSYLYADRALRKVGVEKTNINWLQAVKLPKIFWFQHLRGSPSNNREVIIRTHPLVGELTLGLDNQLSDHNANGDQEVRLLAQNNRFTWLKT